LILSQARPRAVPCDRKQKEIQKGRLNWVLRPRDQSLPIQAEAAIDSFSGAI
jgi:hypothetical protein